MDGRALARLRYERGYALRELAERAGVSYYTIWMIEQGKRDRPHPSTLAKLARALGVEPTVLMAPEEENDGMGKAAA